MFGFSIWEVFLILVIALLVVGPERLPGLARSIGTWVRKIKKFVANAKAELDSEFNLQDMKSLLNSQESEIAKLRALVEETRQEVQDTGRHMLSAVDSAKASVTATVPAASAVAEAEAAPSAPATEASEAPSSPQALSFEEEIRAMEAESGQTFVRPFAAPPQDPPMPESSTKPSPQPPTAS
ncbi:Sec-independent protein translocase protein TatB [Halothiobacillus sp. DCM-1]|uniref:Sec-independent protein translocase protein TatB n=1 Tax=Halothiobacillus sp. DCM-1 TaxID=3112558 RepID=UPI00324A234B